MKETIKDYHESPLAGNLGKKKTLCSKNKAGIRNLKT